MLVGALIVLVPFWKNEKIRYETEKHDKVKRLYQKYLLEIILQREYFFWQIEKI